MTAGELSRLAAFALTGLALGVASLAALRLTVRAYLRGDGSRPAAAHLARLAIVAAILVWTSRQGAGPLVAMAAGLTLARPIGLRLWGRPS